MKRIHFPTLTCACMSFPSPSDGSGSTAEPSVWAGGGFAWFFYGIALTVISILRIVRLFR